MEKLENYLESKGFSVDDINGTRSWERVRDLDNWIEVEWSLFDLSDSSLSSARRKGSVILSWRVNGIDKTSRVQTGAMGFRLNIGGVIDKIEDLYQVIWLDEVRDKKLEDLGI